MGSDQWHRDTPRACSIKAALGAAVILLHIGSLWAMGEGAGGSGLGTGIRATRRVRRPHHFSFFTEKAPCATLERRYIPSDLETKWVDAAHKWKESGNGALTDTAPYCELLVETRPALDRMLVLVGQLMAGDSTTSTAPDADAVLSRFESTLQCGPYNVTIKEHIEPLVAALRHPYAIDCPASYAAKLPPKSDLFDKGYVLLAAWRGQVQAAKNKYYLDAGAGVGYKANSNQHWMIEEYERRGIVLDRMIYWEAKPASADEILRDVPAHLFPHFTFYNVPAPAELTDGRSPLAVVAKLAKPEDFVSIKIDIDAATIEDGWLRAILDPTSHANLTVATSSSTSVPQRYSFAALIDELFWEHHINFHPMVSCCWGGTIDPKAVLADSMGMFQGLRRLGIRAHGWQ